ncbi:hypothetical protein M405DRAFT_450304 [Rhizopogon salebrosus TDB-379]|nr:hypothetical protein M405DRAFT_450304 [Rhizopogon salebrosus TDB-379]
MHRALFILEILVEIFKFSDFNLPWYHRSRKTLGTLARTCKTFHDPAMDLLWADMDNLQPLFGCVTRLHPMIYGGVPKAPDFVSHCFRDIEPLSESEAHQFLRHAARVRSLIVISFLEDEETRCYHHIHLLSRLPSLEICVFPRLLSLTWMVQPQDRRYVPLFFSPMLRRCCVDMNCDFKSIARPCVVLEDLYIGPSYDWSHTAMGILCDTIRSCKCLVKLCCPLLDFAAWKYISSLPTLVTLEINGAGVDEPLDWDGLDVAHFLNLAELSLDFVEPSFTEAKNIATVIQHSEFPSLKEFQFSVVFFPWRQAEQFLRALSR